MEENNTIEMVQEIGTLDPNTFASLQEGETITLSLEEASQLLMDEGQFAPGTYQIVTTPGLIQQGDQVPYEIVGDNQPLPQQTLVSLLPPNIRQLLQQHQIQATPGQETAASEDEETAQLNTEQTLESSHNLEILENQQSSDIAQDTGQPTAASSEPIVAETTEDLQLNSAVGESLDDTTTLSKEVPENVTSKDNESTTMGVENISNTVNSTKKSEIPKEPKIKIEPKPDLDCPISVSERTEVVINGKKCVLLVNPDTKEMCAYPLLPPYGRKRGRPKKPPKTAEELEREKEEKRNMDISGSIQDNSAVEGLLELSNTGPDGVRRSSRARKKNKILDDYENPEISGDEGGDDAGAIDDDDDADVVLPGYKRRKLQDLTFQPAVATISEKRPRGRPRRYPPPGQAANSSTIPAVFIPSSNGQTLMMAPLQGVANLDALQVKSLPTLAPQVSTLGQPISTLASQVSGDDSTMLVSSTVASLLQSTVDSGIHDTTATIQIDSVSDTSNMLTSLDGDILNPDSHTLDLQEDGSTSEEKPTVIQIPENLLPMFVPKKDPIRLGLKASESDLEKLKCPKCDYQAYYTQQYQEHIATHTDVVFKCKCCSFNSFDREELLTHFKETHPRCICNICDFMAEHAYVIKRHMVRHNKFGCMCNICGKAYKDQYILKMHIKMVHMPAEVLFECNICLKKFTRKAHLKRHLRIHDPEKPFKCPHCEYRGCERSDISKHLLIHEEPKHVCDVCGKAFRHQKNKELHVKRHNGQKDYKCGVCGFYGYTFTDIRKHIERKHGDVKSLVCDKCGMGFKAEIMLRDHQLTGCDGVIEQALSIATSDGGTSQAMIQIPSTLSVDGQSIMIDGQEIAIDTDGAVNITLEQVLDGDDEGIQLLDDQMQISADDRQIHHDQAPEEEGQLSESDAQVVITRQVDDEDTEDETEQLSVGDSHLIMAEEQTDLKSGISLIGDGQMVMSNGNIVGQITMENGQIVSMADVVNTSQAQSILAQGHNLVIEGQEVTDVHNQEIDLNGQESVDVMMVDTS